MTKLSALEPILNGNPADAILVNDNFTDIRTHVNDELINRDGSVQMQAPLILSATAPSDPLHAVRLADLGSGGDLGFPAGAILDYAGATVPAGNWLLCDGGLYDGGAGDYATLFAIIGTAFNTGGEGPTQFRVPDFTANGGGSAVAPGTSTGAVGTTGGNPDTVVAQHNHTITNSNHDHSIAFNSAANADNQKSDYQDTNHKHSFSDSGSITNNLIRLTSWTGGGADIRLVTEAQNRAFSLARVSSTGPSWSAMPAVEIGTGISVRYGTSTVSISGDTGNNDSDHRHDIGQHNHLISGRTGDKDIGNTENAGVTATTQNYHPYVVVNKIIRY